MLLTENTLRRIIAEEYKKLMEGDVVAGPWAAKASTLFDYDEESIAHYYNQVMEAAGKTYAEEYKKYFTENFDLIEATLDLKQEVDELEGKKAPPTGKKVVSFNRQHPDLERKRKKYESMKKKYDDKYFKFINKRSQAVAATIVAIVQDLPSSDSKRHFDKAVFIRRGLLDNPNTPEMSHKKFINSWMQTIDKLPNRGVKFLKKISEDDYALFIDALNNRNSLIYREILAGTSSYSRGGKRGYKPYPENSHRAEQAV